VSVMIWAMWCSLRLDCWAAWCMRSNAVWAVMRWRSIRMPWACPMVSRSVSGVEEVVVLQGGGGEGGDQRGCGVVVGIDEGVWAVGVQSERRGVTPAGG
jgi:hypothetical protein